MPGANTVLPKTFRLTAAIEQWKAVQYVSTDQDAAAPAVTLGGDIIGIVQEPVTADQVTRGDTLRAVQWYGPSHAIAGAALDPGTRLRVDAQGRMVALAAATANQSQVGIAWTKPTQAGDKMVVLLTPGVKVTTV